MPLKETIFDLRESLEIEIEPIALRMRSANTLLKIGSSYRASSTDRTGFQRLLSSVPKDRVAVIGGGGTARAALGALDPLPLFALSAAPAPAPSAHEAEPDPLREALERLDPDALSPREAQAMLYELKRLTRESAT